MVYTCPPPRFATLRDKSRPTRGPEVAGVARGLGQDFMLWQRFVADVAMELLPDGRPAYRLVIVTVPRQNGKTSLVLAVEAHRCIHDWGQPQRISYTAQNAKDAENKLLWDQVPILLNSDLAGYVRKVNQSNGKVSVLFVNGSRIALTASTESAGHGPTLDLAMMDETFADTDDRREQALLPSMITRANAQTWVSSTAGTDTSFFLKAKVDLGRAAALDPDPDSRVAFFEWSAPDDADADDPETWKACMPALGITISIDDVKAARDSMEDAAFRRAFLNQWTAAVAAAIPGDRWRACQSVLASPSGFLVFGVDINPERTAGSIVAAGSGGSAIEVITYRNNVDWLMSAVIDLLQAQGGAIAIDPSGPAGLMIEPLRQRGFSVVPVGGRDLANSCAAFYDAIMSGLVAIRPDDHLDGAVAGAVKRRILDSWAWARSSSVVDICPLVAATVAFGVQAGVMAGVNIGPIFAF